MVDNNSGKTKENPIDVSDEDEDDDDQVDAQDKINSDEQSSVRNNGQLSIDLSRNCPYLNTIDRKALDFDFEKLCSVSLSKVNVYACLVCGKYFQGRGRSTHAFTHSVSDSHHVFLNLETLKFYCLPDNYEVIDDSLRDILHVLRPLFDKDDILRLDSSIEPMRAYDGKQYYPGIVGLNNLKYNDYCNVIIQALSHVTPLRNFFLLSSKNDQQTSRLATKDERYLLFQRFGELICKLWNPRNFKAHVSPHEMLQAIVSCSKKKFEFTTQSDPIVFLGWFLNSVLGPKREKNSIIKRVFQGKIRIASRLLVPSVAPSNINSEEPQLVASHEETYETSSSLYLTLDLPPMPLFPKKDEKGKVIKPRVSIYDLLKKFDGKSEHEFRGYKDAAIKRYELLKLPKYLIIYYKRFTKNTFFTEKNTHLVDFPISQFDLGYLLAHKQTIEQEATPESTGATKSGDNIDEYHQYNLIANIVHDGEPVTGKGTYRVHILHRNTGKWFEMQDLYVTEMVDTTRITLSECYIQIWELRGQPKRGHDKHKETCS